MEPIFLGVDGGGTKTALCLLTARGQLVAEQQAPSIYCYSDGMGIIPRVLAPAVRRLCAQAGVTQDRVTYAFFGLPGYGESSTDLPALNAAPRAALGHDRYACGNDLVCGWAGSLGAADGVNVVSGTGSGTYGERSGKRARVGGWGEAFGDEGSAYWIAVRGLNAFSRMSDGRMAGGPLLTVLRVHLGLQTDLDLIDVVLNQDRPRREGIAALCPQIVRAADLGDEKAAAICDDAARELALLVSRTCQRLGFADGEVVPVSWSGGTFNARRVRDAFRRELLDCQPLADLRRPLLPPVVGAALYAARLAGTPLEPAALGRLMT